MAEQIAFESGYDMVSVWPGMDGYSLHLCRTNVHYGKD